MPTHMVYKSNGNICCHQQKHYPQTNWGKMGKIHMEKCSLFCGLQRLVCCLVQQPQRRKRREFYFSHQIISILGIYYKLSGQHSKLLTTSENAKTSISVQLESQCDVMVRVLD